MHKKDEKPVFWQVNGQFECNNHLEWERTCGVPRRRLTNMWEANLYVAGWKPQVRLRVTCGQMNNHAKIENQRSGGPRITQHWHSTGQHAVYAESSRKQWQQKLLSWRSTLGHITAYFLGLYKRGLPLLSHFSFQTV